MHDFNLFEQLNNVSILLNNNFLDKSPPRYYEIPRQMPRQATKAVAMATEAVAMDSKDNEFQRSNMDPSKATLYNMMVQMRVTRTFIINPNS